MMLNNHTTMPTVCISGLGYIGLPTACVLACYGYKVVGADVDEDRVNLLSKGIAPIQEPDLDRLLSAALRDGSFIADISPRSANIHMICVPTPFKEGHCPDISYVMGAATRIAPHLKGGELVILESTVPVGTTDKVGELFKELRPELHVGGETPDAVSIAYCPERVLPGHILHELIHNNRIVGGVDAISTDKGCEFYRGFVSGKVQATDACTAEMVKLAENSFRDVQVAFANELSLACDKLHLDVWKVIELANQHPRVQILRPGPGVGGHCIAVDPWFLVHSAPDVTKLLQAARAVNDYKAEYIAQKICLNARPGDKIGILGVTFKPDVDDTRQSPALQITRALCSQGYNLLVCDPHLKRLPDESCFNEHAKLVDLVTCLDEADIIVGLVAHSEFKKVNPEKMRVRKFIDVCGIFQNDN